MHAAPTLRARLSALRRLARLAMVGAGAGRWCCALAAAVAAHFALDRLLRPGRAARAALLAAGGATLLALLARWVIAPLVRRLPLGALVLEVEGRLEAPPDLLPTALSFDAGRALSGASVALAAGVVRRAEAQAGRLAPQALVRWAAARRWGLAGGVALAALAAWGLAFPATVGTWFSRGLLLADVQWPRRTRLALVEAPEVVARGEDAVVSVRARGALPRRARLYVRPAADGQARRIEMDRRGPGRFTARLVALAGSVRFSVRAGDGLLEDEIRVVERPAVAAVKVVVRPPRYIAPAPVELDWTAPAFEVPKGSRATVTVSATKELGRALVRCDGGERRELPLTGPDTAEFTFDVARDLRCEIALVDTLGIRSAEPLALDVKALEDRPPDVTIQARGVGEAVTPQARLPLEVSASDDYGLRALWLTARHGDDGVRQLPRVDLWRGEARPDVAATHTLDLRPLELPPRGRLALTGVARDTRPPVAGGDPQLGRSHAAAFRLVTAGELLAGLLVQQRDLRRDLEDQLARQRALIERLSAGEAAEAMADEERSIGAVLGALADGYRDVLDQMLNSRVIGRATHEDHVAGVTAPLRALGGPDGPPSRAALALAGGREARERAAGLMAEAAARMERLRERMLLLEGYAALVTSVEEIGRAQEKLLRRTEREQEDVLDELGIE